MPASMFEPGDETRVKSISSIHYIELRASRTAAEAILNPRGVIRKAAHETTSNPQPSAKHAQIRQGNTVQPSKKSPSTDQMTPGLIQTSNRSGYEQGKLHGQHNVYQGEQQPATTPSTDFHESLIIMMVAVVRIKGITRQCSSTPVREHPARPFCCIFLDLSLST
ncbi:hypothetical protein M409DRAFT_50611 [Zasmidium cellare ATCC 36951]|uniref:Uncharacterized protein n=1 Tax=Zasmidium cellare ATCC 36951 TaxID=1080233 RepID=A0A6A6CZ34_ZASCE|nr:uncharacterized protein M409DRAFT_50611 [Zasmidium cellare ATCC 36951]KAF2172013.1 hypothetical protein M409DRAFT_50611 [Zasmidium cellare ATCC 36951]